MCKIINMILILSMLFSYNVSADDYSSDDEIIRPHNNKCIITMEYDTIKKESYDIIWMPFRSVLEAIGAEVTWDSTERNIGINYNGEEYIADLDHVDIEGMIDICKSKYKDYTIMDLYLKLSPWGGGGGYEMIYDSTYVDDYVMIRLLYYFGYYVSIDKDNKTFEIVPVNEKTDKKYQDLYSDYFTQPVDDEVECLTLDIWCCSEYIEQYGVFNVINCSSERLENDDLMVYFEFTYNDKELERELYNKELWEVTNNDDLRTRFGGTKVYKKVGAVNDYYVVKCDDYYVGYSVVPSVFLKVHL